MFVYRPFRFSLSLVPRSIKGLFTGYIRFHMMYPGYQRFFLACDERLRRPQANTAHEKLMAHKVESSQFKEEVTVPGK